MDEEVDLVGGEDSTMPCSSPEADDTLAAPLGFQDPPGIRVTTLDQDLTDPLEGLLIHTGTDSAVSSDNEEECRLELLNDVRN